MTVSDPVLRYQPLVWRLLYSVYGMHVQCQSTADVTVTLRLSRCDIPPTHLPLPLLTPFPGPLVTIIALGPLLPGSAPPPYTAPILE